MSSETTEAIDRASSGMNPGWTILAVRALVELAQGTGKFTTDAIWSKLDGAGIVCREPRALGAIMNAASRLGFIVAGGYIKSSRAVCHSRPVREWTSTAEARSIGSREMESLVMARFEAQWQRKRERLMQATCSNESPRGA